MFSPLLIIGIVLSLMGILALIALVAERRSGSGETWLSSGVVYSLSMAVYCTSWTFYGSIGMAATSGFLYSSIYLGPTLATILFYPLLNRLILLKSRLKITSVADLVSTRYGNSEVLGALCALIVLVGLTPYIALQLKSILFAVMLMSGHHGSEPSVFYGAGLAITAGLAVISCALGLRKLDPTERHPGMIAILSAAGVIKLVAFIIGGVFICYYLFDGVGGILDRANSVIPHSPENFMGQVDTPRFLKWLTYLLLAGFAVIFLPRQFQVIVVENTSERHLRTASWLFPAYLLAINFFVLPVALAGLSKGYPAALADTFLLLLPLENGHPAIALIVFIGGFLAAAGMVMMESVAIATMVSNHLVLPVAERLSGLAVLRKHLLACRWLIVGVLMGLGYVYMLALGNSYALVSMGMISFAAILQFAPVVVGGLVWKKGSAQGAMLGLVGGFGMWAYTLFIPAFAKAGFVSSDWIHSGPWGVSALRPEALFGLTGLDAVTHSVFWSMLVNLSAFVLGSLVCRPSREMARAELLFLEPSAVLMQSAAAEVVASGAAEFNAEAPLPSQLEADFQVNRFLKEREVESLFAQYCEASEAARLTQHCFSALPVKAGGFDLFQLATLHEGVERALAGVIGPTAAHLAVDRSTIFSAKELEALSGTYARIVADMKLSPEELGKRIDFHLEREKLIASQADELKQKLAERDRENQAQNIELSLRLQQLQDTQQRMIESSKFTALGEMSAGLAHEVNTPLATIQLLSEQMQEILRESPADVGVAIGMAGTVEATALRIAEIVKGLRAFSRQADGDPGQQERVGKIIEDTLSFCRDRFRSHGVQLSVPSADEAASSPLIPCRPTQISQVLLNLLNNAHDAVSSLSDKWIRLEIAEDDKFVRLSVTDSGSGIPKHLQAKLFQPFFTTKPVGHGTGLGLSVSKGIVEAHGGTLEIDDSCQNTRFIVTLPKSTD